jgi:type II secretory pathway component PulM
MHFRRAAGGVISPRMQGRQQTLWRRRLSREVAGLIALKLAALALLWWLFFSPAHRTLVDADAAGRRLGMPQAATLNEARTEAAPAGSGAPGAHRD